jgi:hypothetical protein
MPGLQLSYHTQPAQIPGNQKVLRFGRWQVGHHLRLHRKRQPDLGNCGCCSHKARGRDADNREESLIQPNGLSDDPGIASETSPPVGIAQHGNSMRRRKLFTEECPPECRRPRLHASLLDAALQDLARLLHNVMQLYGVCVIGLHADDQAGPAAQI